jgi:hypothetical protein
MFPSAWHGDISLHHSAVPSDTNLKTPLVDIVLTDGGRRCYKVPVLRSNPTKVRKFHRSGIIYRIFTVVSIESNEIYNEYGQMGRHYNTE